MGAEVPLAPTVKVWVAVLLVVTGFSMLSGHRTSATVLPDYLSFATFWENPDRNDGWGFLLLIRQKQGFMK